MFEQKFITESTGCRVMVGKQDKCFKNISIDSRRTFAGDLFIAIKGEHFDGHDFVNEALEKGQKV